MRGASFASNVPTGVYFMVLLLTTGLYFRYVCRTLIHAPMRPATNTRYPTNQQDKVPETSAMLATENALVT